jgi:flagellin-like hook-associated protein FlgL
MAISDISLTAGMRGNLLQLQQTTRLMDRTQERLSTGKRVNSALDDATNFFAAKNHISRANDLSTLKDAMGEAVQTIKAADNGITGISSMIESAKGLIQAMRGADSSTQFTLAKQFNTVLSQINTMAADASYKGTNFVTGGDLTVTFDEDGAATLTLSGLDVTVDGTSTLAQSLGILSLDVTASTGYATTKLDSQLDELNSGLNQLRDYSSKLASNLTIITVRQDFTDNMVNTLKEGADNLTEADTNEEGANMLMLQTRQQLGITALSLASQNAQAVLRLF